jgi:hypothetical protein
MPFYGSGTEKSYNNLLGLPPPILKFSGLGKLNIPLTPVVLVNYTTSWPADIDYIPTEQGDPFPVIMEIDITVKESYSPAEFSRFDLFAYKQGNLEGAFKPFAKSVSAPISKPGVSETGVMPNSTVAANAMVDTSEPVGAPKSDSLEPPKIDPPYTADKLEEFNNKTSEFNKKANAKFDQIQEERKQLQIDITRRQIAKDEKALEDSGLAPMKTDSYKAMFG